MSSALEMQIMVTIVDRGKAEAVAEICSSGDMHVNFVALGSGTASSEILDYLGIGETRKDILITPVLKCRAHDIMYDIVYKMQLKNPGSGIIFTLPVTGATAWLQKALCHTEIPKERKEHKVSTKHDLVSVIVEQGGVDAVMTAARSAGASGGTVLHSRSINGDDAEKFYGNVLQPEKEIVLILVPHEIKKDVMLAITKEAGLNTKHKGLLISTPVDDVMGLRAKE